MAIFKRIISLLLIASLFLTVGCKSNNVDTSSDTLNSNDNIGKSANDTIRVLYSSKDSLDPFECVTEQNTILGNLIFEPLLILNNNYEIEYRLAKSAVIKDKECAITLKDVKFSDGSRVTSEDIVFSFNKAKVSNTRYASSLKYVTDISVSGSNSVIISLKRKDPYFINLLTFPILKKGSDELKDTDNQELCPIGAGRYVFDNNTEQLKINKHYYGKSSVIKTIQTVDAPDNESVEQAVKAGMVDFYYTDLSNSTIPKMNGNTSDISLTRIVFLGVNPNNHQLSNSLFRQAISAAIDRKSICSSAYFGKATPALGPFPTIWKETGSNMNIEAEKNLKTSAYNIELAGYTKKDKSGYYLLKNNNPITFSLLVNSSNPSRVSAAQKIADNLKNAGIKIVINSVSDSQYNLMLDKKQYDLYIGEVRFDENMDLGGLVYLNSSYYLGRGSSETSKETESNSSKNNSKVNSSGNSSNNSNASQTTNIAKPGEITLKSSDAYKGYYSGKYSLQDLITAFIAELPVIPVCFKNGLVIYSDRFGNGITPSRSDLFHGIELLK